MVNPSAVVAALVEKLRAIPDLVSQLGDDEERIVAYEDIYPQSVNLQKKILTMDYPSILVAYADWGIGSLGHAAPINHRIVIYIKPAPDVSYSDMTTLLVAGVPAGQPLSMLLATIHEDLDPMRLEGRCERILDPDSIEYWQLTVSFNERT